MKQILISALTLLLSLYTAHAEKRIYDMETFAGIRPNATDVYDNSSRLSAALERIRRESKEDDDIVLKFSNGRYDFFATDAHRYDLYISNHDNPKSRAVGFMINSFKNLTLEGNGAEFMFHGRMIPFYIEESNDVTLRNFTIDFADPQICQVEVVSNDEEGIRFRVPASYNYKVENGRFSVRGLDWELTYDTGIAFEANTRHVVYQTSDLGINMSHAQTTPEPRVILAPNWKDKRLVPGTRVALRSWGRPCPGIVLDRCDDTRLHNINLHYAEGMGLVAQLCEDIDLKGFNVSLRGKDDPRYFTTQADATHFSQCRGHISSVDALYEGMMDDAINVHGIYLKIKELKDKYTLRASFEHGQCYGFRWADEGDEIGFLRSKTMERIDGTCKIKRITPADTNQFKGCKEVWIEFQTPYPADVNMNETFGIENESWLPTVYFARNTIRNNRARGALFSSPRRTICENNLFDHTSGTAILLCGDCNGWYESGPVRELIIRKNKFVNALTNMFQFTNGVISIYPEIPNLKDQKRYFHGGKADAIQIVNNEFHTFDMPLLYAKSVDGLVFEHNKIFKTNDYKPFHWNQKPILLEKVINAKIQEIKP